MKVKGIRILDKVNRIVSVELPDILEEIPHGNLFHWSILCLEAMGHLGEGKSMPVFEKQIDCSERGQFISWSELNMLSKKFYQIIDVTIIGCKDKNLLHRYESDKEMYETCDIVIEMIDSSYWKLFSKDEQLINRLASKFKEITFLTSDFEK